jgi:uridine nucleosidase
MKTKCDPEASYSIFSNIVLAAKTTLIPLDLTHQVLGSEQVLKLIEHGASSDKSTATKNSIIRKLFLEIITFFAATYEQKFAMTGGPPLHDPVAVAAVFAPGMFDDLDGERYEVYVVHDGDDSVDEHTRKQANVGQCVRTILKLLPKGSPGVRVPRTLEIPEFWQLIDLAIESVAEEKEHGKV